MSPVRVPRDAPLRASWGRILEDGMDSALIYLDNAATVWPKPEGVYRFMNDFYREMRSEPGAQRL